MNDLDNIFVTVIACILTVYRTIQRFSGLSFLDVSLKKITLKLKKKVTFW